MTNPRDPDGSTRITGPSGAAGRTTGTGHTPTAAGADLTGRMTGSATPALAREERLPSYKTSAAATFGLVFGLAALFCAFTGILAPAAVLLGLIGLVVAVVGLRTSRRPGVTGHKLAVGGLVTAVLGLLLGGAVTAGLAAVVNSNSQLDRISHKIDQLRTDLPSGKDITNSVQ